MKKISLDLDQLRVESFDTTPDEKQKAQGTVFGHAQITPVSCAVPTCEFTECLGQCDVTANTCGGGTCDGTCAGGTCDGTCGGNTCDGTCGGGTCGGTCGGNTCGGTCFCIPTLDTCQSPSLCDGYICY